MLQFVWMVIIMKKLLSLLALLSLFIMTGCTQTNENKPSTPQQPEVEQPEAEQPEAEQLEEFEILNLEYTGPSLDPKWFELNSYCKEGWDDYEDVFEYQGTGYAFEVELYRAVDGDTAYFTLPAELELYNNVSSFRFLNMDTEETYTNGEEEWGKPASNYTKNLLENAYSIVLQNDPNEGIYDIYDRGLAWIWIKSSIDSEYQLLNYLVVQQGLAKPAYLYGAGETIYYNDISYKDWMFKAQQESIDNNRGYHGNFYDPYWDYINNRPNNNWYN